MPLTSWSLRDLFLIEAQNPTTEFSPPTKTRQGNQPSSAMMRSSVAVVLVVVAVVLFVQSPVSTAFSSVHTFRATPARWQQQTRLSHLHVAASNVVDGLLEQIQPNDDESNTNDNDNESSIPNLIQQLEEQTIESQQDDDNDNDDDDSSSRFQPLLGLYDVSYTKTQKPGENPVGGKWTRSSGIAQRLLRTRRTFQHVLPINATGIGATQRVVPATNNSTSASTVPVVAEAVNVISLEALFGLLRVFVLLRGDAVALTDQERNTGLAKRLSSRAVKVYFDAPRIVVGMMLWKKWFGTSQVNDKQTATTTTMMTTLCNLNVGPQTSVLLDTTYCDDRVRIGMGGTSGTRFVFVRCPESDVEANEFRGLLSQQPLAKAKALSGLLATVGLGVLGMIRNRCRWLSAVVSVASALAAALVAFSSGGIERDELPMDTVVPSS